MIKAENILQKRIEYFKNKEYEKIYDIYSLESEFRRYFENKEIYHNNLVNGIFFETMDSNNIMDEVFKWIETL